MRLYRDYKPMGFFGHLSLILFIIAAILFIPVLMTYCHTGLVPNFPTLIVSGFVAMAAIQSLFVGILLMTIVQKDRRDFEYKLQVINQLKKDRDD